ACTHIHIKIPDQHFDGLAFRWPRVRRCDLEDEGGPFGEIRENELTVVWVDAGGEDLNTVRRERRRGSTGGGPAQRQILAIVELELVRVKTVELERRKDLHLNNLLHHLIGGTKC